MALSAGGLGAGDKSAVFGRQPGRHTAKAFALRLVNDTPGDRDACLPWAKNQKSPGQMNMRGQLRALVLDRITLHLNEDGVPFVDVIADAPAGLKWGAGFGQSQKPVTGPSDGNERRLQALLDGADAAQIDIADKAGPAGSVHQNLDQTSW